MLLSLFPLFRFIEFLIKTKIIRKKGLISFLYYNSKYPKQIYNIKKDGLNYNFTIRNYINIQSNILEFEIKGI